MSKKAAKKSKHKESAAKSKGTHSKAADKSVKQPEGSANTPSDSDAGGARRTDPKTRVRRGAAPLEEAANERNGKPAERRARKIIPVPSAKPEAIEGELSEGVVGFANSPFAADPNEELTTDSDDEDVQAVNESAKGKSKAAKPSKQDAPKGRGAAKQKASKSNTGEARSKAKSHVSAEAADDSQATLGREAEIKAKGSSKKASKKQAQSKEPAPDSEASRSVAKEGEEGAAELPVESAQKTKRKRSKRAPHEGGAARDRETPTDTQGDDVPGGGASEEDTAAQGNDALQDNTAAQDNIEEDGAGSAAATSEGASPEAEPPSNDGAGDEDPDEEDDSVLSLGDSQSEEDGDEEQLTEEEENQRYLKGILEALLFASDKPLTGRELARAARIDKKRTLQLLAELRREYRHRGVNIVEVNGGFVLRSNPAYGAFVQKALALRPVKLSRAQLETLAIIAYRQPITRPEIDDIRGVDSGQVLKGLADRDLIKMVGKKDEAGRPMLYGTTDTFLELFNLDSLKGLPNLREFTELTEDSREKFTQATGETIPGPTELSDSDATAPDETNGETVGDEASGADAEQVGAEPSAAELFTETESAEIISEQTPVPSETELEQEVLDVELDAALAADDASTEAADALNLRALDADDDVEEATLEATVSDVVDAQNVRDDDEGGRAVSSQDGDYEETVTEVEASTDDSDIADDLDDSDVADDLDGGDSTEEFEEVRDEGDDESNADLEGGSADHWETDDEPLSDDELK